MGMQGVPSMVPMMQQQPVMMGGMMMPGVMMQPTMPGYPQMMMSGVGQPPMAGYPMMAPPAPPTMPVQQPPAPPAGLPLLSPSILVTHFPSAVAGMMLSVVAPFGPIIRSKILSEGSVPGLPQGFGAMVVQYSAMASASSALTALPSIPIGPHRMQVQSLPPMMLDALFSNGGPPPMDPMMMMSRQGKSDEQQHIVAASAPAVPQGPAYEDVLSTVLRVSNIAEDEDIANDETAGELQSDVRQECSSYGPVTSVIVPRRGQIGAGFVFVKFAEKAGAKEGFSRLSKRTFGGLPLGVSYYDEDAFRSGKFDKEPLQA